jgi:hypothetical protein
LSTGLDSWSDPAPANPEAFFEIVAGAFDKATGFLGATVDHDYLIAGQAVRIRFAGTSLVPIIAPAFAHHAACAAGPAGLKICVWDCAASGVPLPRLPWPPSDYLSHGEVRGYSTERFRLSVNLDAGQLNVIDLERGLAFHAVRDAAREPFAERGSPLLRPLHWWMERCGRQLLHAAAVGRPSGGVLLAGKGGSGKSTTALACLDSDLGYLSDDYCLVSTDGAPRAFSLYSSGKVNLENQRRFPGLAPSAANEEKVLYYIAQQRPEKIANEFPLLAVLVPDVGRYARTRAVPVSAMTALRALGPSTIFQLSRSGETAFRSVGRLVRQVPCYRLELAEDLSTVVPALARLLTELGA